MNTPANFSAVVPSSSVSHWLEVDDATLMRLLAEHGQDINTLESRQGDDDKGPKDKDYAEVVPLPAGWLRLSMGDGGELVGQLVSDPIKQHPVDAPFVFMETEIDELQGWVIQNRGISPTLDWWSRTLRDPQRESYAVAIHNRSDPEPKLLLTGVYPGVVLCESEPPAVAFVEPHPDGPDRARARLLSIITASRHDIPRVLAEGPAGGLPIEPCSTRRFIKVGHGVRGSRIWQVFDVAQPEPQIISAPEPVHAPELIDIASLGAGHVLIYAANENEQWRLDASEFRSGRIQKQWRVATGRGRLRHLVGGREAVLARISRTEATTQAEDLLWIPLSDTAAVVPRPLLSTAGMFKLRSDPGAASTGFVIAELTAGTPPVIWYLDSAGRVLNPSDHRPGGDVRFAREHYVAPDGYECVLDIRWRGGSTTFRGPVILVVYGAYGVDIDLDSDQELRHWLDRGYAVATAHVRGGGDTHRHRAGSQGRRDRSLADTTTAVEWLRSGRGSVTATKLCVIGASAGGFLAASLLVEESVTIDAAVIVNGYIDPLEALLRHPSLTAQADRDEWGDPEHDLGDREALEKLSPLRKLTAPGAPTLVIVSARDARVDPRQGLTWALRSRELGGDVTLWYDPSGNHDRWGAHMQPDVLVNWVAKAFEQHEAG